MFVCMALLCREHGIRVENLDPVTIGIFDESNSLHAAVVWFFHKFNALLFKSLTCGINVWHQNSNMSKATRIRISVMVHLIWIGFTAPITEKNTVNSGKLLISLQSVGINMILLGQFYSSLLAHSPTWTFCVVDRNVSRILVAHKVQWELGFGKIVLLQQWHAQYTRIERQRLTGIFDTVHRLLEQEILRKRLMLVNFFLQFWV